VLPVQVSTSATGCVWAATVPTTASGWVNISGPSTGTDNGTLNVVVGANTASASRAAAITIAGTGFSSNVTLNQSGVGCTFALSSPSGSVAASGGPLSVNLTTPTGCAWTADPGANWITATAGANGSSSGTVSLQVAANSSTQSRQGVITIGGQSYTVTEAGVSCSFSLSVDNPLEPSAGGTGTVTIGANGTGCSWVASSNADWVTPTVNSGSGSETLSFTTAPNAAQTGRSATLTVGGQNLVVNQAGQSCAYTLQSTSANMPSPGGSSGVGVISAGSCTWTASTGTTWIHVTDGASGNGNGTVSYSVDDNIVASARSGTMTIAGQTFSVTQAAATCGFTLGALSASVGELTGSGSFTYTTSASGCSFNVASNTNWLTVTNNSYSGTTGTVNYSYAQDNGASTRNGVITVGDQPFTVAQAPSSCGYTLSSYGATFSSLGGAGSVPFSMSAATCVPSVVGVPPSVVSVLGLTGAGTTVSEQYNVAPFLPVIPYVRQAQVQVNGQPFNIKQTSW
jgi:hypothetical protein